MTTLNARANQAWRLKCEAEGWDPNPFYNQGEAFEEGWETGYKAATEDIAAALEAVPNEVYPVDIFPPDGTTVDAQSAKVMRFAYPAAANIAREIGGVES